MCVIFRKFERNWIVSPHMEGRTTLFCHTLPIHLFTTTSPFVNNGRRLLHTRAEYVQFASLSCAKSHNGVLVLIIIIVVVVVIQLDVVSLSSWRNKTDQGSEERVVKEDLEAVCWSSAAAAECGGRELHSPYSQSCRGGSFVVCLLLVIIINSFVCSAINGGGAGCLSFAHFGGGSS